jgi:hypothetical protein
LLAAGPIGFIDRPVAARRVHGRNTSLRPDLAARAISAISRSESAAAARFRGPRRYILRLSALKAANYARCQERKTLPRLLCDGLFRALFRVLRAVHDVRVAVVTWRHG